jgi:hypothetical protein
VITEQFEFTVSQFIGDDIETLRSEKFALVIKVKSKNDWLTIKTEKDIKVEIQRTTGLDYEHIKVNFIEANHISIISEEMKENEEKYFIRDVFIEELKQTIHRFMITKEVAYQGYEKTFFSIESAFKLWVVLQDESIKINEHRKKNGKKLNDNEKKLLTELNNKPYKEIKKDELVSYVKIYFKKPLYLLTLLSLIIGFLFMCLEGSGVSILIFAIPFFTIIVMTINNIKSVKSNMEKITDIKKTLNKEGFNEETIRNYKYFRKNLYNILKI